MVIPGHLAFCYSISYLRAGHTSLTPTFLAVYNSAALLQVRNSGSRMVIFQASPHAGLLGTCPESRLYGRRVLRSAVLPVLMEAYFSIYPNSIPYGSL